MSKGPVSQSKLDTDLSNNREKLVELFKSCPIPDEELLVNLGLYMRSGALARILFINEIYQKILDIPGLICEFGIWWGQSLVLFENLRAVYEPYNHTRNVVGFDTFEGYTNISDSDKRSAIISEGVYGVGKDYKKYLEALMNYHEQENAMRHIRKHELIKGDATVTSPKYFDNRPEALVALAFFDMAIYEPTKVALEAILPRLVSGSVIAFDEFCNKDYPGETKAAIEILGLTNFKIYRSKFLPDRSYFIRN